VINYWSVAQSAEQVAVNHWVGGSSPSTPAIYNPLKMLNFVKRGIFRGFLFPPFLALHRLKYHPQKILSEIALQYSKYFEQDADEQLVDIATTG
jgi:hypothetical protein